MNGHEHARRAVLEFLQSRIPAFLEVVRTQAGGDSPADPAATSYLLADELPDDAGLYPCVVVRSTDATAGMSYAAQVDGEPGQREFEYGVEVIVAAARREFSRTKTNDAPSVQSSVDRDRLMLAARWALMSPGDLDAVTRIARNPREETGAAAQLLDGKPVAAGTLAFSVVVIEDIPALDAADAITGGDLDVTPSLI